MLIRSYYESRISSVILFYSRYQGAEVGNVMLHHGESFQKAKLRRDEAIFPATIRAFIHTRVVII